MELTEVMRTTFACRKWTDEPVDDQTLIDLFEVARFAPTGGNRQGVRAIVVKDPTIRAEIAKLTARTMNVYVAQVAAGESPWNTVHPTGVDEAAEAASPEDRFNVAALMNAPVVVVFVVDLSVVASMDSKLDRIGVVSGGSVYPFVWNFLLAARNAGLGGVMTTGLAAQEPEAKDLLRLPDHYAIAAVVPLGRPVKQLTKLTRNPVSELVTVDRFDGAPLD